MTNNVLKAHIALLSANLIYGLNYVISKAVMPDYFHPRAIIFIRAGSSVLLLWFASLFMKNEKIERKDLIKIAIGAVFGIAINQILFFEGLNLTTVTNSSIIMTTNPIMVMIFSWIILKERITILKITGIIAGCAGALLLILNEGDISLSSATFLGNLLIFINALSFALYIVLMKPLMKKYGTFAITKWLFTIGLFYITPVCIDKFVATSFPDIPVNIWLSVGYIVIGATIIGYLLYNYSLKTVSPTVASSYIYLQPFLASVFSIFIFNETLTTVKIFSALLIFSGVFLVSFQRKWISH